MLSSFIVFVSEVRSSYKITAEYSPDFRRDLASSSPDRIWSKLTEPFARLRTIVLQRIFTAPRRWPALNAKNDLQSKTRHFALSSFINLFKTLQSISQSSSIVTIFLLGRGLVTVKLCFNNNNTSNPALPVRSVMLCYPPESFTTTGSSLSVLWMGFRRALHKRIATSQWRWRLLRAPFIKRSSFTRVSDDRWWPPSSSKPEISQHIFLLRWRNSLLKLNLNNNI